MADSTRNTSAANGTASASAAGGSVAAPPAELRVLVVTPIAAIVKELQSRLSTLPAGVRLEVADALHEQHLDEQIAQCDVLYGEPKEIQHKLHVSAPANTLAGIGLTD